MLDRWRHAIQYDIRRLAFAGFSASAEVVLRRSLAPSVGASGLVGAEPVRFRGNASRCANFRENIDVLS